MFELLDVLVELLDGLVLLIACLVQLLGCVFELTELSSLSPSPASLSTFLFDTSQLLYSTRGDLKLIFVE